MMLAYRVCIGQHILQILLDQVINLLKYRAKGLEYRSCILRASCGPELNDTVVGSTDEESAVEGNC